MVLRDYHVHTEFSFDSKAPMDACVKKAIANGLCEIAFTDHFDPYAAAPDYPEYDAEGFFVKVQKLQAEYAGQISILAGVEAGQAHLYTENVKRLLESHPFDFVIGSVHNVTGDLDLAFQSYTLANASAWLEKYFLEAAEAAETGLYDVFGHLNYICRYIHRQKIPINVHDYEDLAVLVLRRIVSLGKGIEINVSPLRDRGGTTLPSIELIRKYKSMGGEIVTVGSDAHMPKYIGVGIKRGLELAKRAGFRYITAFRGRKPEFCRID